MRVAGCLRVLSVALLVCGPAARADDAPAVGDAVDAVRAAHRANDRSAIAALAARREPDPWLVAHVLEHTDPPAAAAYAAAVPPPIGPALRRHVPARQVAAADREAYAALQLAEEHLVTGRAEDALRVLEAAVRRRQTVLDARALYLRGEALDALARPVEAAGAYEACAETASLIGWTSLEIDGLRSAGLACHRAWRIRDLRRLFERMARLQESVGDRRGAVLTVQDLGTTAFLLDDPEGALAEYERAFRMSAAVDDLVLREGIRADLGRAYKAVNEPAVAYAHLVEAIRALEGRPEGTEVLASAVADLGGLYEGLGLLSAAVEQHRRALALAESQGDVGLRGVCLGNLARVLQFEGRYEEAREHFDRAAEAFAATEDRWNLLSIQTHLGEWCRAVGRFDEATRYDRAVLESARRVEALHAVVIALEGLAQTAILQGRHAEASTRIAEALAAAERQGDLDQRGILMAALAVCHEATGRLPEAVAAGRGMIAEIRKSGGGRGDPGHVARLRAGYAAAARAAARIGDVPGLWTMLEAGRAQALRESLGGRRRLGDAARSPVAAATAGEVAAEEAAAREALRAALAAGDAEAAGRHRAAVNRARDAVRALDESRYAEARVGTRGALLGVLTRSMEDLQRRLAPSDAFVLYGLLAPDAVAVVVTRDAARIVSLGAVDRLRSLLARAVNEEDGPRAEQTIAALREALVTPLGLAAAHTRVAVAPEGAVAYAPVAAIFGDRDVSLVPSGAAYEILLADRGPRAERRLAVGDPDLSDRTGRPALALVRGRDRVLGRLPGTAAEAKAVARGPKDVLLTGRSATERGLREALGSGTGGRWQVVHLACHGLIDRGNPQLSALALAPDADDDGLLMAREILGMRVPADLVVLAACETAQEGIVENEGLPGLAPAFLLAGSPRVVAGLWKVDDAATKALMDAFYASWDQGTSAAGALRAAQAAVRAVPKWSHPRFWAPWVVWGLPD